VWLLAIQALLRLLGFAEMAERLVQSRNDRVAGMNQQKLNDVEASRGQDADAAKIHDDVARLSDGELDAELRGDGAKRRNF
jgi:hypothetical protein